MMPLRVIVVEDQPLAREHLVSLLETDGQVEVLAQCANGLEALAAIPSLGPDLVFLDVQMPEMNAFDVIEAVGVEAMPPVVFVTAFDAYALKAFEVHAFDYLLKPFGPARLSGVVARARRTLARRPAADSGKRYAGLLGTPSIAQARERLVVRSGGRVLFLRRDAIEWVAADGNYVHVHADGASYQSRERMSAMEERLGSCFARIHRSTLVNLKSVVALEMAGGGEYDAVMKSGTRLRVTRLFRPALEERLRTLE